jgi:hypothetical protein
MVAISRLPDAHDLRLSHFFVRKPDTFAAEASVLESSERHGVESVVRRVVDHDPACLQPVGCLERGMQIVCEDAGVQTVFGAVGERQCLIQCLHPLKNDNRAEYFLLPQVAFEADVLKYRWSVKRTVLSIAAQQCGAAD